MIRSILIGLSAGLLLLPLALGSRDDAGAAVMVFQGARILTAEGAAIDNGVLVVHSGKIVAVGPAGDVQVPDGATIRDVSGKVIIPGLVDTHSHIGIYPRPSVP